MTTLYHKRKFNEPTTENNENWGNCEYYFETNQDGEIIRQIEPYQNGKVLRYSEMNIKDEYGFLADQSIDLKEFSQFEISKIEFENKWEQ